MVKQAYKRENISTGIVTGMPVPPTVYEEPEKTLMNFPSSIMNGVTQEGGLVTLTFKAIKCVELVEKADYMRRTILRDDNNQEQIRITEEKLDSTNIINELQREIQELQNQSASIDSQDWIKSFQDDLSNIVENKGSLENFKHQLFKQLETENAGKTISFINESYKINRVDIDGIEVEKFEDVKQIDLTPYQKQSTIENNSLGSSQTPIQTQSENKYQSTEVSIAQDNVVPNYVNVPVNPGQHSMSHISQ